MALSHAAAEALAYALEASEAIETAGRLYGPMSEEARLARAAFDQWEGKYKELMGLALP